MASIQEAKELQNKLLEHKEAFRKEYEDLQKKIDDLLNAYHDIYNEDLVYEISIKNEKANAKPVKKVVPISGKEFASLIEAIKVGMKDVKDIQKNYLPNRRTNLIERMITHYETSEKKDPEILASTYTKKE